MDLQTIVFPTPIPYYAQVASPELAEAIFSGALPAEADPRWAETGAKDPMEYAYWVERACGVACVKMCVEALGGPARSLVEWAREGVARGGYLVRTAPDGEQHEVGWRHDGLAYLMERAGLHAQACPCPLEGFAGHLAAGRLVIASVSYEIGTPGPVTKRGGHLVVVSGVRLAAGKVREVILHNPSGRTKAMRSNAQISAERFEQGYTGRGIVVGK